MNDILRQVLFHARPVENMGQESKFSTLKSTSYVISN